VGAELGAAQNVSAWMALAQAHRGVVLADRLPKIAALFAAGLIGEPVVRTMEYRTGLVTDAEAIARVDALLAEHVMAWGPLSVKKIEQAVDAIVDQVDPGALRRARSTNSQRDVRFGAPSDEAGYTTMWARLYGPDRVIIESRVQQLVGSVCEDDPRPAGDRRSDALTAMAAGMQRLVCGCGKSECGAAGRDVPPPSTAVIHVVADAATLDASTKTTPVTSPDQTPPADTVVDDPLAESKVDESARPTETAADEPPPPKSAAVPPAFCPAPPAFVIGAGVLPAPLLAATIERATVREIVHPGDGPPEPQYRPSRALADFVRCRDLTCRWPGCDKPAYDCDLDHTVPWPFGPTHASNIKCYCRFHHLLKTFWCGVGGWREQQLPDGTLIVTSPTGHTYTTKPGSALLFPALCQPTATLWAPGHEPTVPPSINRALMMPKRRRTRNDNLARRIQAERKLNNEYVAQRNKPPPF